MSYELDMREEQSYLHVRARGTRTFEAVAEMAIQILNACIEHGTESVIVDVRELKGRLSTIEAYEVPTSVFPKLKGLPGPAVDKYDHSGFIRGNDTVVAEIENLFKADRLFHPALPKEGLWYAIYLF